MPKFSIVMPTWNRAAILPNTITSILNQTYKDFELLIMDDGSTDDTWDYLQSIKDPRVRLFRNPEPLERIVCRTKLMREGVGDWGQWVDSDDEINYGTLEILNANIERFPEYKVFNFGQVIHSLGGSTIKLAKELPDLEGSPGMDHFDTGMVGTGGFIYHRDCLEEVLPKLPQVNNVFDFADRYGEAVDEWFNQNKPGVEHQKYNKDDKWVGNPWGDDHYFMWLLTRNHKSKKIPINPYVAYVRTENWAYERADNSGTMG